MTVASDDIFLADHLSNAQRASCVELLRGDTYLRTEAEFAAVGKPRGGVDIDGRCVHTARKGLGSRVILGDYRLAVTRAVFIDVRDGFVNIVNYPCADDKVKVFPAPILLGRRLGIRQYLTYRLIASYRNALLPEPLADNEQSRLRYILMDKQTLAGVTDGYPRGLGVNYDIRRLVDIGSRVDIDMAIAVPVSITGTVAFSITERISPAPPLGISRST